MPTKRPVSRRVELDAGTDLLEIEAVEPGLLAVRTARSARRVTVLRGGASPIVLVDDRVVSFTRSQTGATWCVAHGGHARRVAVSEETARKRAPKASVAALGAVSAPMPGRVIEICVVEGQTVEAGTQLFVIEAMKMENAVFATGPGTVAAILVARGGTVERGAVLARLV